MNLQSFAQCPGAKSCPGTVPEESKGSLLQQEFIQ